MKAYECTRCDLFGTSGDPESQRCECDDVEDTLRSQLAALQAERDAAVRECDELRKASAWKPSEVWREEVADEVAEAIAAWLDGLKETHRRAECDDTADDLECLAADIRSGAWRAVREGSK